ncbi:MAG: winged helix-turn-helix domain-containing protein [Chloroflexota bacterium]|nr:winged helix-turn-helix domain-containing protein [Chloroflexota bacterium]
MTDLLAELFSSKVRAAVLGMLLPRPHRWFSLTELSRTLGLPVSSLQHECYKLARLGLLRDQRSGNVRRYAPDPTFPLLKPLTTLVLASIPLAESLSAAAEEIAGLEQGWLTGEPSGRHARPFLVVIGSLGIEDLDALFERARAAAAAAGTGDIELAYYPSTEWARRLASHDPFVTSLQADVAVMLHTGAVPAEAV